MTAVNPNTVGGAGSTDIVGSPVGVESSLSNWVGPYATDMLGKGKALAETPYEAYTGPLTAGASGLQDKAFAGLAGLVLPTGDPTLPGYQANTTGTNTFGANETGTNTFGAQSFTNPGMAAQFMNPFLEQALDPQLRESRRQAEMTRMQDANRLSQAGAFGGSRQAIMESEGNRNLLQQLGDITGRGYSEAFGQGRDQFNTEEDRRLQQLESGEERRLGQFNRGEDRRLRQLESGEERRLGQFNTQEGDRRAQFNVEADRGRQAIEADRKYGIEGMAAQMRAGDTQRAIEAEGIAADRAQFEEERLHPYKQLQYMQSLLQGLPLEAKTTSYAGPSDIGNIMSGAGGVLEVLRTMGIIPPEEPTTTTTTTGTAATTPPPT